MGFDTINAPDGYFDKISLQNLFGLYYHSVRKAYRSRLVIGSLSLIILFTFSFLLTNPYATIEAAVNSHKDSAVLDKPTTNSSEKAEIERRAISYKPLEPLETIAVKGKAVQLITEKGIFDSVYLAAEQKYGTPWEIIAAVHQVESGQSGDTQRVSSAGALGPMQFMPATFESYKQDGDGDGTISIYDVHDAIYSAAKNLAANGAISGNIRQALFNYNHSDEYVEKVLDYAKRLGYSS